MMEDKKRKLKEQFSNTNANKSGNTYMHGSHSDMLKKYTPQGGHAAYNGKYANSAPKSQGGGGCKSCGGGR